MFIQERASPHRFHPDASATGASTSRGVNPAADVLESFDSKKGYGVGDHAEEQDLAGEDSSRSPQPCKLPATQVRRAKQFEFPFKVHAMLEDAAREGNEDIVSWSPCGKAFRIHKSQEFQDVILPRYFTKGIKLKSFKRQLNIYCFQRVARRGGIASSMGCPENMGSAYCHNLFVRGNTKLCSWMTRTVKKRTRGGNKDEYSRQASSGPESPRTNTVQAHRKPRQQEARLCPPQGRRRPPGTISNVDGDSLKSVATTFARQQQPQLAVSSSQSSYSYDYGGALHPPPLSDVLRTVSLQTEQAEVRPQSMQPCKTGAGISRSSSPDSLSSVQTFPLAMATRIDSDDDSLVLSDSIWE